MKRLSQTLRIVAALIVSVFSNGVASTLASAYSTDPNASYNKAWVCKYVTTDNKKILKSGNNGLVSSSVNSIADPENDGVHLGDSFNDNQGYSYVVAWDDGGAKPDVGMCSGVVNPATEVSFATTVVCGPNNDIITPTSTDGGVNFSASGWSNNTNVITASLTGDFSWSDGTLTPKTFSFTDNAAAGCITVTPVAPLFNDVCGISGDTYTITATPGVTYYVNGVPVTTYGTFPATGTVTVTATADTGYLLGAYPVGGWSHTYEGNCTALVPAKPAPADPCGLANATWVLPNNTDTVTWSINADNHLIATAVSGYEFAPGVTTHDFGLAPDSGELCITALPEPPAVVDPCGLANASWSMVPTDTDEITWELDDAGHLIARTTANYQFDDGTLVHDYDIAKDSGILCAVVVEPQQTDFCGTEYDTITWEGSEGVSYAVVWNDDHTAATVTASATEGYAIPEETQTVWELNFDNTPCKKVTICHATDSAINPYERITVNVNAADGVSGNSGQTADHYSHTGPIYYTGIDTAWGDIIPAIEGVHDGLNLTTLGQYILDHNCLVPAQSVTQYELTPCTFNTNSTDVIKVTITNTVDETGGDVIYTVSLGQGSALNKVVTIADGESATVTFSGLSSMAYTLVVTSSDGTVFEPETIAVGACTFTPQVLGTSTTTPRVLPATIADTGAESTSLPLILGLMLSAFTYYVMLRRQEA